MAVSANTLFHFTKRPEKLLSILHNSFVPNYRLEDLSSVLPDGPIYDVYVPMVCFCDIPLSQIKDHLTYYGDYGIGLKKSWGIRKGISPVVYVAPDSRTAQLMRAVVKEAGRDSFKGSPIRQDLVDFCKYIKAYQGKELPRDIQPQKGRSKKIDRIYYDEREWRYSPSNFRAYAAAFGNDQEVPHQNKLMQAQERLSFQSSDVKYIIVAKGNEISSTIRDIENLRKRASPRRLSENAVRLLASRVISAEQIKSDM
jgi:Putative abortive phage resistance protein AbiGi, antitoxin